MTKVNDRNTRLLLRYQWQLLINKQRLAIFHFSLSIRSFIVLGESIKTYPMTCHWVP